MSDHYRPQLGASWLKADSVIAGPYILYSGSNPRIVAGVVGTMQVPATLVRIMITGPIAGGIQGFPVISSIGPCWSEAVLVGSGAFAADASLRTYILDWDFRLIDHVLVVDPTSRFARGFEELNIEAGITVSGEALVTAAPLSSSVSAAGSAGGFVPVLTP